MNVALSECCDSNVQEDKFGLVCCECMMPCDWYEEEDDGQGGDMTGAGDLEDNIINGR